MKHPVSQGSVLHFEGCFEELRGEGGAVRQEAIMVKLDEVVRSVTELMV